MKKKTFLQRLFSNIIDMKQNKNAEYKNIAFADFAEPCLMTFH